MQGISRILISMSFNRLGLPWLLHKVKGSALLHIQGDVTRHDYFNYLYISFQGIKNGRLEACRTNNADEIHLLIRIHPDMDIAEQVIGRAGPDWDLSQNFYSDCILEFR